jgi:phosphoenolpyruvate carboxykinase (GTP)
MGTSVSPSVTSNPKLRAWIDEVTGMLKPDSVRWCDGSPEEYQEMLRLMVDTGVAMWLDPAKRPNSILVRSDPADVARVTRRTPAPPTTGLRRPR